MNPNYPIAIAHQWLKKQREDVHGHIGTWKPETMDQYHRDLGLLVDFVTDCWPKQEGEITSQESHRLYAPPSDGDIQVEAQNRAKKGGPLIDNHDPSLRRIIEGEYSLGFESGAKWVRQLMEKNDISTHISPCPTCGQKHEDGICVVEESRGDGCHAEKPVREDGL